MSVLQTTYKITKAHTQQLRNNALLETERLDPVRNFLLRKSVPFDYDVDVYNWDGSDWKIITYDGQEFLAITDPNI